VSNICLVSVRHGAWRARSNVSSDAGHGGICFFGDVINVFVPREVLRDGNTKIFGLVIGV